MTALALNICLTLVVLLLIAGAVRAIIKQHAHKEPLSCIGCPYAGSCKQPGNCDKKQ